MMIDANLLPFSVKGLVKSKAWYDATPEQRRKFIHKFARIPPLL